MENEDYKQDKNNIQNIIQKLKLIKKNFNHMQRQWALIALCVRVRETKFFTQHLLITTWGHSKALLFLHFELL